MALSSHDIDRYARHLMLKEIGGPGQNALKNSSVLIIGAGGLGSPAALYLAASGVGHIGLVDDDTVSLSNLQRQILFRTEDIGKSKLDVAQCALKSLNPDVQITLYHERIVPEKMPERIQSFDLVLDGSDNFETRYALADTCFCAQKPLISGWLGQVDAGLTTLRPYERASDGAWNPTYRCLFPEAPNAADILPCSQAGVLGPLAGMVGTMMALESLREIVGFGQGLVGVFLRINALTLEVKRLRYERNPENMMCI